MAAQKGIAKFVGVSGRTYAKQFYLSDSANGLVNWDAGNGAGSASPTFAILPEAAALTDVIIAAATTQTMTQVLRNNVPTGDILLNSVQLASIVTRPPIAIPFGAGQMISMIQLA